MRESELFRRLRPLFLEESLGVDGVLSREIERSIGRVTATAAVLERQVERSRARVVARLRGLESAPDGRQRMVLDNCPAMLLRALAHDLLEQSYAARFDDPAQSVARSELALKVARRLFDGGLLERDSATDLLAESWAYLGNARRVAGDRRGAEAALAEAERFLAAGTGDRLVKARLKGFFAFLRFDQGRGREAGRMLDQRIRLLELMGDFPGAAAARIDRGVIACWCEPLPLATDLLERGSSGSLDERRQLIALLALADRLARDDLGELAARALAAADAAWALVPFEALSLRRDWVVGITRRAVGDLAAAAESLEGVQRELAAADAHLDVALVSLDLAAVYAAQGRHAELLEAAETARAIFVAEGLEERALAAFMVLYRSATAERLTRDLAVKVSNFIARHRFDRSQRFSAGLDD